MARGDFYASPLGALYSAYMERPRLSRPIGRLLWGGDSGRYTKAWVRSKSCRRAPWWSAARILRPGGRLVGACFVRGRDRVRQRLLIRPGLGDFGKVSSQREVEAWLAAAGFEVTDLNRSGPMLFFDGGLRAELSRARPSPAPRR